MQRRGAEIAELSAEKQTRNRAAGRLRIHALTPVERRASENAESAETREEESVLCADGQAGRPVLLAFEEFNFEELGPAFAGDE
jgi:hypothetical protein